MGTGEGHTERSARSGAVPPRSIRTALSALAAHAFPWRRFAWDQQYLADATHALHATLDVRATLERLARLAVPRLGDLAVVELLDDPGRAGPASWHRDEELRGATQDAAVRLALGSGPIGAAARRGELVRLADVTPERLAAAAGQPDAAGALAVLGVSEATFLPLSRAQPLGVLAIAGARRARAPSDLHLARELASRASLAIENARRHEAAQRSIRVREEVLAVVSHDLRSPLNALRLGVRLQLRRAADEGRGEAERRSLENLDRAVDRMDGLVADLLDMGRIRAGQLPLKRTAEPVRALLADSLSEAAAGAAERGVVLRLGAIPPDAVVDCDRGRILQVLANVVGNAIKFAGAGGEVVLGAEEEDGSVRFTVVDSGPGIRAEDTPHLFEPWWSSEGGRKLGTGLGLFIARGIVEAHGGAIGVETGRGAGSRFWFSLPRAGSA